ncbi:MAG: O-antigen ligase family protein [Flavobacteriales bacterium]
MQIKLIRNSLLAFFVIGFFFFPRLQTIWISACFITVLGDKSFYKSLVHGYSNKLGILLFVYFAWMSISLVYTENLTAGLKSLETKFSLAIFPLFLPFLFSAEWVKRNIMKLFLTSGLFYIIVSLFDATLDYYSTNSTASFFYSKLGIGLFQEGSFIHPTYSAFFYNVLVSYLGVQIIEKSSRIRSKSLVLFQFILICVFIFLLSSKFGILALAVNLILLLGYYIKKRKKIIPAVVIFLLFSVLSVLIISQSPLKKRFAASYSALTTQSDKPSSTKARLDVWAETYEIILENSIFGVGTGDIRDELMSKYQEKEYFLYQKRGYDSHQQFLQTFASLGVLGFVILIAIFVTLFRQSITTHNFLLFSFTLLFLLFGLVESMLERQAGVVFFVFFGLYLFNNNPLKEAK